MLASSRSGIGPKMPDCVTIFWYQIGSSIPKFLPLVQVKLHAQRSDIQHLKKSVMLTSVVDSSFGMGIWICIQLP
jgi:hypothetical protein